MDGRPGHGWLASLGRTAQHVEALKYHLRKVPAAVALRDLCRGRPDAVDVEDLRTLVVEVDDSPSGRAIRRHATGNRFLPAAHRALAVLELPASYAGYRRSKDRQAFRTNVAKAEKAGLSSRVVPPGEFRARVDRLIAAESDIRHLGLLRRICAAQGAELWICFDAAGGEVALASLTLNGRVALLNYLCASPQSRHLHARWALSGEIVRSLIDRGVGHLLSDRLSRTSDGNVYFQGRLGYRPALIDVACKPAHADGADRTAGERRAA